MLNFRPLTLEDIPCLRRYFIRQSARICDSTVGGTFLWRDYYHTDFAQEGGTLFLRSRMPDGEVIFSMPMGGDVPVALRRLREEAALREEGLALFAAKEDLPVLLSLWPAAQAESLPHAADYLYRAEDLKELRGKHYAGQRNHISQFLRGNPDWRFTPITEEILPQVRAFFARFEEAHRKEAATFREDERKVAEVLDHFALYGFLGGAVWSGEQIVSMALGETMGDTLYVHIEKGDTDYHGAYPMIVREFSRYAAGEGILYINREDDAGDEGLRRSKRSYKPCDLLEKYLVRVPAA